MYGEGTRNSTEMGKTSIRISPSLSIPLSEIHIEFSRSSGPGGQNVNKVSSRVSLRYDVARSPSLTDGQKEKILRHVRSRLISGGVLKLSVQDSRSQWRNRQLAIERLAGALAAALHEKKKRIAVGVTHSAHEARLTEKRLHAMKKTHRQRPQDDA